MILFLLQWNIWYEDIANVVSFIKQYSPDVLCLQELTIGSPDQTINDTPEYVAEQVGYHYYYKQLPITDINGVKLMLANGIFSRFPITDSRFVWINQPKSGGGYSDEYRAYVEATLDVGGKELTVATAHMSYTHRFEETEGKKYETDLLLSELQKNKSHFVFTGDLNAQPGSYTITEVSKLLQNAGPDDEQKTWTTKPFSYRGFEAKDLQWRLDYVFITPDIKVESAEVLKTDYSDHLPILAKLSF